MSNISAIYIVENAQSHLQKSISSIKSHVDEIIVVDIGSIDRTVEVAKALGAKVFKFIGGIDEAKKFAIDKCNKKWVLYLSAEEKIYSKKIKELKEIVRGASEKTVFSFSFTLDDSLPTDREDEVRLCHKKCLLNCLGMKVSSIKKTTVGIIKINIQISTPFGSVASVEFNNTATLLGSIEEINDVKKPQKDTCAIIIVVHNLLSITKKCIDSIRDNTRYQYKLYIVDNGSTDVKLRKYLDTVEGATILRIDNNSGVSNGRNQGVNLALKDKQNKYICLLDNDTVVLGDWLTPMIDFLNKNTECGMIGPLTNNAQGSQKKISSKWIDSYTPNQIINLVKKTDSKSYEKVDFINRFCQVIKSETFLKVGNLESFGLIGWEDYDYCKRLRKLNYDIFICRNSIVYHVEHATTKGNKINYQTTINDSYKKYSDKWKEEKQIVEENEVKTVKVTEEIASITKSTSIVVLTYNNLQINKRFFRELNINTNSYEVIVVDNGSTDGTVDFLNSLKDTNQINHLVLNEKNLGVIKGRNQGIKLSVKDYVICLDNDQIVKKDWLVELHREMDKGFDFVGVEAWKVNSDHMPIMRYKNKKQAYTVSYVGAGGCLMKRRVLEEIGIYDERFGMAYFEDVDICFRAKEAGYKIGWCDKSIIDHLEHQTLIHGQKDFAYTEELKKSHKEMVKKMTAKSKGIKFDEIGLDVVRCETKTANHLSDVTFIIKAFNRHGCLLKLLTSIRQYYPKVKVYVADDGEDLPSSEILELVDEYYRLPFDSGLSAARNFLLSCLTTKYFLLLDDDFLFSKQTTIENFHSYLETNPSVDLVAGRLLNFGREYAHYEKKLVFNDGVLTYKNESNGTIGGRPIYDLVFNFFMAKSDSVRKVKWDNDLKLAEHTDFFYRAKGKLVSAYDKNVVVEHYPVRTEDYTKYRLRAKNFFNICLKNNGIKRIIKDGNVALEYNPNVQSEKNNPTTKKIHSLKRSGDLFIDENYELSKVVNNGVVKKMGKVMDKKIAKSILFDAKIILDELKIPFWLSCGTLLGAVREGDFISHDLDLDIGIHIKDFKKEIKDKFLDMGYELFRHFGSYECGLEMTFRKKGVLCPRLDIFCYYDGPYDKMWHSVWVEASSMGAGMHRMYSYNYDKFNLDTTMFLGEEFNIPSDVERVLEQQYGDWKVPSKEWRWDSSPLNLSKTFIYMPNNLKGVF